MSIKYGLVLSKHKTSIIVTLISLLCISTVLSMPPLPQDLSYHNFVDSRTLFDIPNFYNVISNIPFLLVGLAGLYLFIKKQLIIDTKLRHVYVTLFTSVALLAFGSAYYHLSPENSTLLWDRLPMAIAFMSLFTIVICEFISSKKHHILFATLIIIGISSVLYWHYTEILGEGDLRFYILTQFLPMILITLILVLYDYEYDRKSFYWLVLAAYVAAKLLELYDSEIFDLTGVISGHSLKHIAAACSIIFLIYGYKSRLRFKSE